MKRRATFYILGVFLVLISFGCGQSLPPDYQQIQATPFLAETIHVGQGNLFRGTFSPDGDEFYFFQKVSEGEDYRVYKTKMEGSSWSEPEFLSLGDPDASSMYPVVSPDGRFLVFTSYRDTGDSTNNANLWAAENSGGSWGAPYLLETASTKENYDAGPWFGLDGNLRFKSISPDWRTSWKRTVSYSNGNFGSLEEDSFWDDIEIPTEGFHFWSGTVNHNGSMAVLELSERLPDGSLAEADLWIATKGAKGWTAPERFGPSINTAKTENFPSFSYDDSKLVFVRDFSLFFTVDLEP